MKQTVILGFNFVWNIWDSLSTQLRKIYNRGLVNAEMLHVITLRTFLFKSSFFYSRKMNSVHSASHFCGSIFCWHNSFISFSHGPCSQNIWWILMWPVSSTSLFLFLYFLAMTESTRPDEQNHLYLTRSFGPQAHKACSTLSLPPFVRLYLEQSWIWSGFASYRRCQSLWSSVVKILTQAASEVGDSNSFNICLHNSTFFLGLKVEFLVWF